MREKIIGVSIKIIAAHEGDNVRIEGFAPFGVRRLVKWRALQNGEELMIRRKGDMLQLIALSVVSTDHNGPAFVVQAELDQITIIPDRHEQSRAGGAVAYVMQLDSLSVVQRFLRDGEELGARRVDDLLSIVLRSPEYLPDFEPPKE